MPPRTGYQPQGDYGSQGGYSADGRGGPRLSSRPGQRMPLPAGYEEQDEGEVFEEPVRGRRPSSGDYQQAYREAEADYDDDVPRSKGPWILLGLLLFAVAIAGMSVWYYQKNIKPMMATQSGATEQQVPVVEPPAQAAKAQPEQAPAETPAAQAKKQIYDRIVGDREVTGGQMVPTEETPAAPADGASSIPQPAGDAQPTGVQNGGEEAAPLPIPPPPGDANTQGSLQTTVPEKTAQISTPAAGESQAAVAAPAPGELAPSQVASAPQPAAAPEPQAAQESIADPTPAAEEPVVEKKITTAKPKAVAAKKPATSLGSKPVVLVPPAKKPAAPAVDTEVATLDAPNAQSTGGLYGGQDVTAPVAGAPAAATPAAPRKKRTIADLFNGTSNDENAITQQAPAPQVAAPAPAPAPVAKAAPVAPKATQPVPAAPAPVQTATTGGFMVQLASFRTKDEASSEFARLKAKYGSVFSGYSPIINEALVGGSTRYRLAVGTMPSRDQANAMCSKLFAAGERDCLVRNR